MQRGSMWYDSKRKAIRSMSGLHLKQVKKIFFREQ